MKREKLIEYIQDKFSDIKRKYTEEPYYVHLINVADMVKDKGYLHFEIGLCHDLLEDTDTTEAEFLYTLMDFGYNEHGSSFIFNRVVELTDVFTHESYPKLNRKKRKSLEAIRLYFVSSVAQTVKYADLIDNSESIVKYDPGFARKYLDEKEFILDGMNMGDPIMYELALGCLSESKSKLK